MGSRCIVKCPYRLGPCIFPGRSSRSRHRTCLPDTPRTKLPRSIRWCSTQSGTRRKPVSQSCLRKTRPRKSCIQLRFSNFGTFPARTASTTSSRCEFDTFRRRTTCKQSSSRQCCDSTPKGTHRMTHQIFQPNSPCKTPHPVFPPFQSLLDTGSRM